MNRTFIDNANLVEECRRGDREAMSLLYTRFAPRMLRVISRYVPDEQDARDILHDGFIAAFTRLDSLRDPECFDYWLASVMKNLSLKFLQEQNVASILEEIPEEEEPDDLADLIDLDTLEMLIRQLPEGYQKVFRLAVLENKSHKEISEILGIAPNSSSSQLFHAKLHLRRLVNEYRMRAGLVMALLLAFVSGSLLYFRRSGSDREETHLLGDAAVVGEVSEKTLASIVGSEGGSVEGPSHVGVVGHRPAKNSFVSSVPAAAPESIADRQNDIETDATVRDSVAENHQPLGNKPFRNSQYEDLLAVESKKPEKLRGWSAGISFDTGVLDFDGRMSSEDLSDNPQVNPDELQILPHKNHLPVTFGVSVERHFSSLLGLEAGVSYSYLHSDFESSHLNAVCHWHYLEIPVKVNLYAYSSERFSVYGSVGGRLSVPVYSNAVVHSIDMQTAYAGGRFHSDPVWSAGASIGFSYRLSRRLNLYVEPSLHYRFRHDYKVPNLWTDNPWSFSIPVGIRFRW